MLIHGKKLVDLPVYTQSGVRLGKVFDLEIEIDGQLVANYEVSSKNVIKNLLGDKLVISREQVISISEEKMVVEDSAVKAETLLALADKPAGTEISAGIATSAQSLAKEN